ncbi:MAG: hypothetical protein K1000chlam2_01514 [Chlamydiae bacterium]|nr:hypothetical protein [Chlamydiota bacterium]
MQVYALDENRLISTLRAEKGADYRCPECLATIRLRSGDVRQSHFFHLKTNSACRQSQKGLIHLRLQRYVKYLFDDDAEMEKAFPSIGRIADIAAVKSYKIVEIQYSPMTLEEAKARCHDYESLGYTMIWILHDHTFNKKKVRPVEQFLRTKTCYFSNMDVEGNGIIYDQLEQIDHKKRILVGPKQPVNLRISKPLPPFRWPRELAQRAQTWPLCHEGDLLALALKGKPLLKPIPPQKLLLRLKDAYVTGLYQALERSSR